ncbi:putative metal-dependent hydrolase [Gaetbulibacter aquiaggeris]|uniref:Metal-dependent hydrolase n=1 Tax=Gaetbulibacter aquiaggeris TaxID=1735373 RepID=A0ABW7MRZ3_9FLAO
MTNEALYQLQYPIGKFEVPNFISKNKIEDWISILEHFPNRLEHLVKNLSDKQLDSPYRLGGWTVRQVVHHLSDSHHHSYTRFKWALTEENPVIKAYDEGDWAELYDSKTGPIEMSLQHLKAIHFKLVYLLKSLSEEDLNRSFIHPQTNKEVILKHNIGLYAWHSNHHYAHIENLLNVNQWI